MFVKVNLETETTPVKEYDADINNEQDIDDLLWELRTQLRKEIQAVKTAK